MKKFYLPAIVLIFTLFLATCKKEEPVVPLFEPVLDTATLKVEFVNKTINGVSFLWDFGDGEKSTLHSPSHTYLQGGSYNVTLTVMGNEEIQSIVKTVNIVGISAQFNLDSTDVAGSFEFEDLSYNINGIVYYRWDFGDGDNLSYNTADLNSIASNPNVLSVDDNGLPIKIKHQFKNGGIHQVVLRLERGTETSDFSRIVEIAGLEVDFTPNYVTNTTKFTFTEQSKNLIGTETFFWDFGNGQNSSLQNPPAIDFLRGGIYNVTLKVTQGTVERQKTKTINIPEIIPNFDAGTINNNIFEFGFQNTSVNMTDNCTITWDFGDGETDTGQTSTHTYDGGGFYNVTMLVSRNDEQKMITKTINIGSLSVDFSATRDNDTLTLFKFVPICTNLNGDEATYTWQWGDNLSNSYNSTNYNYPDTVIHNYSSGGFFNVTLIVKQGNEEKSISKMVNVPVSACNFNIVYLEDNKVNFVVSTTNLPAATYHWSFGDGSEGVCYSNLLNAPTGCEDTIPNPHEVPHTYTQGGTYSVTLEVQDEAGNAIVAPIQKVVYLENIKITELNIEDLPSGTHKQKKITVTVNASDWDKIVLVYGDGSILGEISANGTTQATIDHDYCKGGNFVVTATVERGGETDEEQESVTIPSLTASFTAQHTATENYKHFTFTPTVTNFTSATTLDWAFGDASAPLINQTIGSKGKQYNCGGMYNVVLTAKDGCETVTVPQTVNVPTIQINNITGQVNTSGATQKDWSFEAELSNSTPNTHYVWDFDDGTPLVTKTGVETVDHTFCEGGYYNVKVAVSDGCDQTNDSKSFSIPSMVLVLATDIVGNTVTLDKTGSQNLVNNAQCTIDWGDNSVPSTFPLSDFSFSGHHTYTNGGIYNISVTVSHGCESYSVTKIVNIGSGFVDISWNSACSQLPCTYNFTATVMGVPASTTLDYQWSFDGGSYTNWSTSNIYSKEFTSSGMHSVCVRVRLNNNDNQIISVCESLEIPAFVQTVSLLDGLVAFYPFMQSIEDFSGNNNHLALANGGDEFYSYGHDLVANSSFEFNNHTTLEATGTGLNFSGSRSISFWLKPPAVFNGNKEKIIGSNNFEISLGNNNLYVKIGANEYEKSLNSSNSWHHFVVIHDSDNNKLYIYVNGILYTYNNVTGNSGGGNEFKFIDDNSDMKYLDDVRIYNRVLNSSEVQYLFEH